MNTIIRKASYEYSVKSFEKMVPFIKKHDLYFAYSYEEKQIVLNI